MTNKHTELQIEWDGDRFEWSGARCKPAIEAEVSSGSHYAPWIEFGDLDPKELCRRFNYHQRLREALEYLAVAYADPNNEGIDNLEYDNARDLLAELDNMENGS